MTDVNHIKGSESDRTSGCPGWGPRQQDPAAGPDPAPEEREGDESQPQEAGHAQGPGDRDVPRLRLFQEGGGHGASGLRTFIVNENNTLFWKDTQGEPVLEWPTDEELQADWEKLD